MNDVKPSRILRGAVFLWQNLFGTDEHGKTVKTSRVVGRHAPNIFETENTIYTVEFVPGGETTIPEEWR